LALQAQAGHPNAMPISSIDKLRVPHPIAE
jgi:hypothetical protein